MEFLFHETDDFQLAIIDPKKERQASWASKDVLTALSQDAETHCVHIVFDWTKVTSTGWGLTINCTLNDQPWEITSKVLGWDTQASYFYICAGTFQDSSE